MALLDQWITLDKNKKKYRLDHKKLSASIFLATAK